MNVVNTSQIPHFPKEIILGWAEVNPSLSDTILTEKDKALLDSFTSEQRKGEFLAARHLLKKLVEGLNWDSQFFELKKEELGKPFLETELGRKFVSFSHTRELVFCAVSASLDIGLDVETLDRKVNPAIVKRILSENEWEIYGEEDPISLWTMKEASVKSLGTGLRTNLKELELEKFSNGRFTITINQKEELKGICFNALNHCISIAY